MSTLLFAVAIAAFFIAFLPPVFWSVTGVIVGVLILIAVQWAIVMLLKPRQRSVTRDFDALYNKKDEPDRKFVE